MIIKGKFEGTIGIIKSRNSMDKQYNAQKEKLTKRQRMIDKIIYRQLMIKQQPTILKRGGVCG